MDIKIKTELRTCEVNIPEEVFCINNHGIEVARITAKKEEKYPAFFHTWHPKNGNAIVEDINGCVHLVDPQYIRFTDRMSEQYDMTSYKRFFS